MKKIETACIIDDDEIYTYAVKKIIAITEIASKTIFFANGQMALDFFRDNLTHAENLPDLVLLDINMPVLDGWQFMDEFCKLLISKKISIYIVSSSIDEADFKRSCCYRQITDFIVKPITANKLREIALGI